MKKTTIINRLMTIAVMLVSITAQAAEPSGYYNAAEGKTGQALLKALEGIVGSHTTISYDNLWTLYKYSDTGADGYIIDMYSTVKWTPGKKQCGSYSVVGDCYNREHSFPKSWFNDAKPMYSDAFHLYPTDGKVNGQRSNYPFGVCANGTTLPSTSQGKALGKLGKSTYPGYSGTVFEPVDQYKGDFARSYFYMAAAYNSRIGSWHSDMLAGNSYPAFSAWAIKMLLEWNAADPVGEKEKKRNEVIYNGGGTASPYKQGNRNPFIDHPELAEYIWGNKNGQTWTANATMDPVIVAPSANTPINLGVVATGSTTSHTVTVKGANLGEDLEISVQGDGLTTSVSSIARNDAMSGKDITLYYIAPATAGTHTGTLTIESSEISTVRVPITVTVVSGIPASATSVTAYSFVARWENQKDAPSYDLYVYEADGTTLLYGYPTSVVASSQQYTVNGLTPLTTYKFQLKSAALESNVVEVTTHDCEHIIDITSDNNFAITAHRGQATLPVIEAQVYTENVNEAVTLSVTGEKFDISLDRTNWSKQLDIDSDGETFYIRLNDVSTLGTFAGTLRASSASYSGDEEDITAEVTRSQGVIKGDINDDGAVDVNDLNCLINSLLSGNGTMWGGLDDVSQDGVIDIADVAMLVNIINGTLPTIDPTTYVEDFEGIETGGYWTKAVQGNKFNWNFKDAGIWADNKRHDTQSVRLGKSSTSAITMAEDITTGASKVDFYAAVWSGDGDAVLNLDYSTNGGNSWTTAHTFVMSSEQLQLYSAELNIAGNVRFALVQSSGKRVNIDDFTIVNNPNAVAAPATQFAPSHGWDAVATSDAVIVSTLRNTKVTIYNLDAEQVAQCHVDGNSTIGLPAGTYVVVANRQSKKVIVK